MNPQQNRPAQGWQQTWYRVIFESNTPAGRAFDVCLLWAVLLSVGVVMIESVQSVSARCGFWLHWLEWFFTLLFSLEYIARLLSVESPRRYASSFFGVVDLLALMPTYLSLLLAGSQYLIVIRILRLLRVFRIFKLGRYVDESQILLRAFRASRPKITVFFLAVITLVTIFGTLMYLLEGGANGFTSIPRSIYWAIVTLTTVGYGDIAPHTVLGQALSSLIMLLGYAILAVPTGIVTVELANLNAPRPAAVLPCPACGQPSREAGAHYCKFCGQAFERRP